MSPTMTGAKGTAILALRGGVARAFLRHRRARPRLWILATVPKAVNSGCDDSSALLLCEHSC